MTYRQVSVKADGTGDYTTLQAAVSSLTTATVSGDTTQINLYDSSCASYTFIDQNPGSNWIVSSVNPVSSDGTGGTRIWSSAHGLRVLGQNATAGDGSVFTFVNLTFKTSDFANWYQMTAFTPNKKATVNYENCYFSGYNSTNTLLDIFAAAGSNYLATTNIHNCIFNGCRDRAVVLNNNTALSVSSLVNIKGCTFVDSTINISRTSAIDLTLKCLGSIFDPYTTAAELQITGSSGTLNTSADYCIFTRSQANVTSTWTSTTNSNYNVSLVTGNPAAGQVGFVNIPNDLSLYNSSNNLAINFVQSNGMPEMDIRGISRPQGTYPDAGAFEVFVQSSFQYFLPISVLT